MRRADETAVPAGRVLLAVSSWQVEKDNPCNLRRLRSEVDEMHTVDI